MQWTAQGSVFSAISLWFFVCVWNISGTAQRICAKFTRKTCLAPRMDEFEDQGQRSKLLGTKTAFLAISAVWVGFMFGKTSLASSIDPLLPVPSTFLIMATNKLCSTVGKTKTVHKECTKDHSLAGRSNRFLIVPSPMRTTFTTSCTVRLKS